MLVILLWFGCCLVGLRVWWFCCCCWWVCLRVLGSVGCMLGCCVLLVVVVSCLLDCLLWFGAFCGVLFSLLGGFGWHDVWGLLLVALVRVCLLLLVFYCLYC